MCHGTTLRPTRVLILSLAGLIGAWIDPASANDAGPEYPASRLGVRTAPLLLLSRPDVRSDLGLTAEQAASAERTMSELYVRASALRGKVGPEAVSARLAIDEAQRRWLETQLSPEQRVRLAQIDLQWEGPSAVISRPLVAESLGLSPEQREALSRAIAEHQPGRDRPADPRSLARRVLGVLTPDQQARWKAMLGQPFAPQVAAAPAAAPAR